MPLEPAGVGIQREDRREVEVVTAARRTDGTSPGRAVARADVQRVEVRVVGHRVPHGAAAAAEPPFAGPGLRRLFELRMLEAVLRVARDRIEAPRELAGRGVVRGQIAADAVLAAAVADQHLALHDARRARDGVRLGAVDRVDLPALLAGTGIERDQPAVEGGKVQRVAPQRDAAIDRVAAGIAAPGAGNFRVIRPELLARPGIERIDHAPHAGRIHAAVDHERGRLQATRRVGRV